ncbi:MAG: WcaF family extracellular polysaccharide biosynthesis acetyltransferase [Planctomycetota bacterium]
MTQPPAANENPTATNDTAAANAAAPAESWTNLAAYTNDGYSPGRGFVWQLLWYYVGLVFFESGWFPFQSFKPRLLRLFGAKIGEGVVIKPNVRIKYPWLLEIGDHCWIGQDVWLDNLAMVRIGSHVCVSQGAYFCTGSHNHQTRTFKLAEAPITVSDGAWLAAKCMLLAGVEVGANALVAAGSVVSKDVPPATIVGGVPARVLGDRPMPC